MQLVKQNDLSEQKEDMQGEIQSAEEGKDIGVAQTEDVNIDDLLVPANLGPRHMIMQLCDVIVMHTSPLPFSLPIHGVLSLDAPYTGSMCIQKQTWDKHENSAEYKSSAEEQCEFLPIPDSDPMHSHQSTNKYKDNEEKSYRSDSSDNEYEILRKRRIQSTMHYWDVYEQVAESKNAHAHTHTHSSSDDEKVRDHPHTHTHRRRIYSLDDDKVTNYSDRKEVGGIRQRGDRRDGGYGYWVGNGRGSEDEFENRNKRCGSDEYAAESKTNSIRGYSDRWYGDVK